MISLLRRDRSNIQRHPIAVLQELDKDKAKIIDIKWTVDSEMADRSVLSEELANFCPEYPIYQVKMMDDSLTSTRIDTGGELRTQSKGGELEGALAFSGVIWISISNFTY